MRFRKKPVEVEAVRLLRETWDEVHAFVGDEIFREGAITYTIVGGGCGLRIPTLEGTMLAVEGDWIIRGTEGELYPCKPAAFEATFEPVTS